MYVVVLILFMPNLQELGEIEIVQIGGKKIHSE